MTKVIEHRGLTFRWNGSHTVNVFRGETFVDLYTFGSFTRARATESEFRGSVPSGARLVLGEADR